MNSDPQFQTVDDIKRLTREMLAQAAESIAKGELENFHTPRQKLETYLAYESAGERHLLPIRIEVIAFDERKQAGMRGDLTFRLRTVTGGIDCPEMQVPLEDLAEQAGLKACADNGNRLLDLVNGQIGAPRRQYYRESNKSGMMGSSGEADMVDQSLVINPNDLHALRQVFNTPAATITSATLGNARLSDKLPEQTLLQP